VPSWGYKQGCDFAEDECLTGGGQYPDVMSAPFCNGDPDRTDGKGELGCTADFTAIAYCDTWEYSDDIPAGGRYFSDPEKGGYDEFMDWCPYMNGYTNGLCTDTDNAGGSDDILGYTYGESAACMVSDLIEDGYNYGVVAGCFKFACADTFVQVRVGNDWQDCDVPEYTSKGLEVQSEVTFDGFSGAVQCPPFKILCERDPTMGAIAPGEFSHSTPSETWEGDAESSKIWGRYDDDESSSTDEVASAASAAAGSAVVALIAAMAVVA
jgi:leishmanolysin